MQQSLTKHRIEGKVGSEIKRTELFEAKEKGINSWATL